MAFFRCVLVILVALGVLAGPVHSEHPGPGDTISEPTFRDGQGRTVSLSSLQGRVPQGWVCLTFWCSTCSSCRQMERALAQLTEEMRGKAVVIAVNSSAGETAAQVERFLTTQNLPLEVVFDPEGQLAARLGVRVTTTTVILDSANRIRYYGRFAHDTNPLARTALTELLAGQAVTTPYIRPFG